jgi:hypothetical protein
MALCCEPHELVEEVVPAPSDDLTSAATRRDQSSSRLNLERLLQDSPPLFKMRPYLRQGRRRLSSRTNEDWNILFEGVGIVG